MCFRVTPYRQLAATTTLSSWREIPMHIIFYAKTIGVGVTYRGEGVPLFAGASEVVFFRPVSHPFVCFLAHRVRATVV